MQRNPVHHRIPRLGVSLSIAMVLLLAGPATAIQVRYAAVTGRILDAEGIPLVGYRVTFQPQGEAHTYVSGPTDGEGNYVASLPEGGSYVAVGLITRGGTRQVLQGQPTIVARSGLEFDVLTGAAAAAVVADAPPNPPSETVPPPPAAGMINISGRISDADDKSVRDHRVVFRDEDGEIFVSRASGDDGTYWIALPEGGAFIPVAVVSDKGKRYPLDGFAPVRPAPDVKRDVRLVVFVTEGRPTIARSFNGADRLFLAFFQDSVVVEHQHWEGRLELANAEAIDTILSRFVGAWQFNAVDRVEWGASLALGSSDTALGEDSGITDLDLSAKLYLGEGFGGLEWSAGGIMTLPVGDEEAGLGQDALSTLTYGAVRRNYLWGTLAAHVGFRFTENGRIGGVPLEGRISGEGGVAVIYPVGFDVNLIGELTIEGARFEQLDTGSRLLAGVNWSLSETVLLRGALSVGLADGSPDSGLLLGLATDF
jgi:hypothetical protein